MLVGGAVGALARVALTEAFPVDPAGLPWTTFVQNVSGAFALTLIGTVLAERVRAAREVRLLVGTGVLGAFTTYSTFASEVADRLLTGHALLAATYGLASVLAGLAAAAAGSRLAGRWTGTGGRGSERRAGR